jgi:hypothetical protein
MVFVKYVVSMTTKPGKYKLFTYELQVESNWATGG